MPFKFSKNYDEMCYPFMYEHSLLCDFEVATDELCGHIGAILAHMPQDMPDIISDLDRLQPLAFHLNGSIRGRLAIEETDIQWLLARLAHYREEVAERLGGFVLPRGSVPIPQLHLARSGCKKAIRLMVRIDERGEHAVPMILPRLCNVLCNLLFIWTLVINQRRGVAETPFISKSYG